MAIEASRRRAEQADIQISQFELREIIVGSALVLSDDTDTETTITLRPYTEGTRGSSMIFGMSPCLLMDIKTRMDRALYWAGAGLLQPETTGSCDLEPVRD